MATMVELDLTTSAFAKGGARRAAWWLLGLALFSIGISCSRPPTGTRKPLLVVLPQAGSSQQSATVVGFASWLGFTARAEFGSALRVAAPPEVVDALGLDSLASQTASRRLMTQVRPNVVVLCGKQSPGGLTWRLVAGSSVVATGRLYRESIRKLFSALASLASAEAKGRYESLPDSVALREAGWLLLGQEPGTASGPELDQATNADFLNANRVMFYLRRALEERLKHEDPAETLYRAGRILREVWVDTSTAEWKLWRGAYFVVAQRWSQAERWLKEAWRQNPSDGRVAYWLSHLHPFRLKALDIRGPEEALKRAITLDPLLFDARLRLAELYFGNRRFSEEERVLKELLSINPNHRDALLKLGRLYMVRNDVPKTLATYKRLVDLDPGNADVFYNLGIVYFGTGDLQDAEKLFQRAVALSDHPEAHLYLGFLYEKLGERDKAIAEYRKRIRMRKGPDDQYANEARKRLWELLHGPVAVTGSTPEVDTTANQ